MVTVPVRAAPLFAAVVRPTVPFPAPLAPDVTAIHGTFEVDVQLQPAPAVTITDVVPPPAAADVDVGLIA